MPNLANILKIEISRLARKEVRAHLLSLKKVAAQQRGEISRLRSEVKQLKVSIGQVARDKQPSSEARRSRVTPSASQGSAIKAHRRKLEMSAKDYGLLLGVSGLTVYNWEKGAVPRARMQETIAKVLKLGKRTALARLEQLR